MSVKSFLKKTKQIEEEFNHRQDTRVKKVEEDGEGNWLISYADMMTLLCAFFIMLFSMAKLNAPEFEAAKKEIAKELNTEYVPPQQELEKKVTQIVEEMGLEKDTQIKSDPSGVVITFTSTIFFDTLSAYLSPRGEEILNKLASQIRAHQEQSKKDLNIVVEGHTDGRPILSGPFATNWELSGSRAARVVRLFLDQGFTPGKLTATGFADTRPLISERNIDGTWNEQALSKNRRVVLKISE